MVRVRRLIQKKTKRFIIKKLAGKYSLLFQAINKGEKYFCNIASVKLKFFKSTHFAKKDEEFFVKLDGQILPKIIETGTFDNFHYFFLKNKIKKDSILIDVGSNHGFVSWQLAKLKKIRKIITYEPAKEIYDLSKINLKNIKHIEFNNAGWSNKNSKMILYENPENSGDLSLIKNKQRYIPHHLDFLNCNNELQKIYKKKKKLKIILKTDCQGYDIFIFNSIEEKYFLDIDIYFLECKSLLQNQKKHFFKRVNLFNKVYISAPQLFKSTVLIKKEDLESYFKLKVEFDLILVK